MDAPSKPSWRMHLRGALVALHILAVCALSLPDLGGAMNRKAWKSGTVQHEIETWTARLVAWGMDITKDELEERAWGIAESWTAARKQLLAPFEPYRKYAGVRQRWRMFAAAERVPARLQISIKTEGEWQPVYESRSPELRWNAELLDQERLRVAVGQAGWAHRKRLYKRLVSWIAAEAARDFPEASHVRVLYLRAPTPSPAELLAGEQPEAKKQRAKTRSLEKLR